MPDRIPPHSDDAEAAVLGAALQSKQALYDVMETLTEGDFYRDNHRRIFAAMAELHREGNNIDIVTVTEALKKRKELGAAGGAEYIGKLAGAVPSPSSALQYGKILIGKAILRNLIENSGEIITESYEDREDAADILEKAEQRIMSIGQGRQAKDFMPIGDALQETLKRMEALKDRGDGLTGHATGFKDLDKLTSGLQDSDLIVLAARPGMGKTSLALNIAMNTALKDDATVMIFSLEMSPGQLAQRLLSSEARVELSRIRDGSAYNDKDDMERILEAVERLSDAKINIVDGTSGISVNEIKNKCRRLKSKDGLDLIVVDYLQLMDLSGTARTDSRPENRQQEIATLSRTLKQLAGEMDCPLLVLSQLSRAVESRGEHKPVLSDLRESGAIEQDADIVMFIYKEKSHDEDDDADNLRQLLIEKHRNGETGNIRLVWLGKYTRFGDFTGAEAPPF
ncbi:MAG: replicative DNA helicase [Clostridiales Family XIII bacterium]|jgi:replicative DNA helicase|nr:replicative DNA helicase [Clostridiales Family XIII bacterium]